MAQPEPAADGWVVHADESGSPALHRVDPRFPVFVVAFCLSRISDYAREIAPAVTELKLKYFSHDAVVLHEYDIRRGKPPFAFVAEDVRREFMEDLADCISTAPVRFAASLIDKRGVPARLAPWLDGYGVCLEHGISQIARILQGEGAASSQRNAVPIVAESRGRREDQRLLDALDSRGSTDEPGKPEIDFEIVIAEKALNLPGMQLADLAAHPIARHYLEPGQPNRAWDAIQGKLVSGLEDGTALVDVSRLTRQHPPKRVL